MKGDIENYQKEFNTLKDKVELIEIGIKNRNDVIKKRDENP